MKSTLHSNRKVLKEYSQTDHWWKDNSLLVDNHVQLYWSIQIPNFRSRDLKISPGSTTLRCNNMTNGFGFGVFLSQFTTPTLWKTTSSSKCFAHRLGWRRKILRGLNSCCGSLRYPGCTLKLRKIPCGKSASALFNKHGWGDDYNTPNKFDVTYNWLAAG